MLPLTKQRQLAPSRAVIWRGRTWADRAPTAVSDAELGDVAAQMLLWTGAIGIAQTPVGIEFVFHNLLVENIVYGVSIRSLDVGRAIA